ncbi:hypothetical protein U1Q18_003770 [Sarracenia purpurea var. burkii]
MLYGNNYCYYVDADTETGSWLACTQILKPGIFSFSSPERRYSKKVKTNNCILIYFLLKFMLQVPVISFVKKVKANNCILIYLLLKFMLQVPVISLCQFYIILDCTKVAYKL